MTSTPKRVARRGRIFLEHNWSEEKKARYKAEREAFYQHCRAIFDRLRPNLIEDHYDWFIVIEPDSGDYFIDASKEDAHRKARQKHPNAWLGVFRLNETGACGKI